MGSVRQAVVTVASHPLRSSLAALAVAAAVATTAVVQTALDALARNARETSAKAFGADTFVIARIATGNLSRRELAERLERNPAVTRNDVKFLQTVANGRVEYAATAQRAADVARGGMTFENASVNGTQASLLEIRNIDVDVGRFLRPDEEARGAQVVVLGRNITDALFPDSDPIGQSVRIAGRAFTVVGMQARQGTAGGVSLDKYVWMPITAYERAFGAPPSLQIFGRSPASQPVEIAEDHALVSMRARRHLRPGADNTFDLITPEAGRSFVTRITEQVGAAAIPISLMALVAAIVVVTNTSLVSVTQRTREIGIRRAMGATRQDIVRETLAEAALVGLLGGALGLMAGVLVLGVASRAAGLTLAISNSTAGVSLASAVLSGVVAGWYPARRAATLDVVNALRAE